MATGAGTGLTMSAGELVTAIDEVTGAEESTTGTGGTKARLGQIEAEANGSEVSHSHFGMRLVE